MGAPGCGKGTQSPALKERYNLCHLATGDMLREAVANKTPSGILAKEAMDNGKLVTDEIVFGILGDAMKKPECKEGYILDGVPRNISQAERLEKMGEKIDAAIMLDVPDKEIIERTSGRWLHRQSGRTYHEKFAPPKVPGKDDVTGEPLTQRSDDKKEVVTKRLEIFHSEMKPVDAFYAQRGVMFHIDGNRKMDVVRKSLFETLDPICQKVKPWFKLW